MESTNTYQVFRYDKVSVSFFVFKCSLLVFGPVMGLWQAPGKSRGIQRLGTVSRPTLAVCTNTKGMNTFSSRLRLLSSISSECISSWGTFRRRPLALLLPLRACLGVSVGRINENENLYGRYGLSTSGR